MPVAANAFPQTKHTIDCTMLIYLVVTHHGGPYQNQNVANAIGCKGVYQMLILSQISILGKIW